MPDWFEGVDERDPGFEDDNGRGGGGPGVYGAGRAPFAFGYGAPSAFAVPSILSSILVPDILDPSFPPEVAPESLDQSPTEVREVLPGTGGDFDVVWDEPVRVPWERLPEILRPRPRSPIPGPTTVGRPIEEEPMADWGDLVDFGIDILQQRITGTPPPSARAGFVGTPQMVSLPPSGAAACPPGYRTRRKGRRPRLLTDRDLSDLAALKTITGGGQALNFAVMKAIRSR